MSGGQLGYGTKLADCQVPVKVKGRGARKGDCHNLFEIETAGLAGKQLRVGDMQGNVWPAGKSRIKCLKMKVLACGLL